MSLYGAAQIRRTLRLKSGDFIAADEIEEEGTYPVYGGNGVRGFTESWNTEGPIVLIGRQGAHCGNVQVAPHKCWVSEHALRCIPEKPIIVSYLKYALQSLSLGQYSISAAQPGLSTDNIKSILLPYPTLATQERIAIFLDKKTGAIDQLIEKIAGSGVSTRAQRQATTEERGTLCGLLLEYRLALITAAVMGKLEA
jgi:type I restriction enzyme, S subunit